MYTLWVSAQPLMGRYSHRGCYVSTSLVTVGEALRSLLSETPSLYITIHDKNIVEGRSWEMCCVMALVGRSGAYSGTVEKYRDRVIEFGLVPGIAVKRSLGSFLTANECATVRV